MRFNSATNTVQLKLASPIVVGGQVIHQAGELVTMAVVPADVTNQTEELNTYLGGYRPFGFAADMAVPIVLVDKEKGTRRDFSLENAFELVNVKTGRAGAINEVKHLSATTAYSTEENALAAFVPWSAENDSSPLYRVEQASGEMLMDKLAISREVEAWTLLTTAGSWASTNRTTLTASHGTLAWDTGTAKNPLAQLRAGNEASAQPVTDIFMNPRVAGYFLSDTEVRNTLKQFLGDNAPPASLAQGAQARNELVKVELAAIGLPPLTICPAKRLVNSVMTFILDDSVVMTCAPPVGMPRDGSRISTAYTFRVKGPSGTGITTNRYQPTGRGLNGGIMVESGYVEGMFMCSTIAGYLIGDVLAT